MFTLLHVLSEMIFLLLILASKQASGGLLNAYVKGDRNLFSVLETFVYHH